MGVDAERDVEAVELAPVPRRAEDEVGRNDVGGEDALLVIDVMEEEVRGADALLQPLLD